MTSIQCPICIDNVINPVYSRSRHVACKSCIEKWYAAATESGLRPLSPNTRAPMDPSYYGPLYVNEITTVPFSGKGHIVAILDCSGSMSSASKNGTEASPSRISMMIHMVKMLANIFSTAGYYLSIMQFGTECSSLINKAEKVSDQLIESLCAESGGTDMATALITSVSLHGLEPTYIMFTDGEPNCGTEATTARVAKNFGAEFKLHVVGFGPMLNNDVMYSLAMTGHGTYTYIFDINTSSVMMSSLIAYLIAENTTLSSVDSETRLVFIEMLEAVYNSQKSIPDLRCLLQGRPQTEYCKALQDDVYHRDVELGQISKAMEHRTSWGKYYLSAILRAHQLQYTMSDIEPSLQHYASLEFNRIRTDSMKFLQNLIFRPVTGSDIENVSVVTRTIAASTGRVDTRGGCFAGDATINMFDKSVKYIRNLCRGDQVVSHDNTGQYMVGIVDCIVAYQLDRPMNMYGDFITAYHPVYVGHNWYFPRDILTQGKHVTDYVYNIMLYSGACTVYVNQTVCITLGHNIVGDVVAQHPYFGSDVVRNEIMTQPGYREGLVRTTMAHSKRGPDNLICGMF